MFLYHLCLTIYTHNIFPILNSSGICDGYYYREKNEIHNVVKSTYTIQKVDFQRSFSIFFRNLLCVSIQMFITTDALTYGLQCTCVILVAFAANHICHIRNTWVDLSSIIYYKIGWVIQLNMNRSGKGFHEAKNSQLQ